MIVYRKRKFPAIYGAIPFLREQGGSFFDSPEDYELILLFQKMVAHKACISERESVISINYAISFPDNIVELRGDTNELVHYTCYLWRLWDVVHYIKQNQPTEAIDPFKKKFRYCIDAKAREVQVMRSFNSSLGSEG